MNKSERTILVVCADRGIGREYLRELQRIDGTCPARLVSSQAEARRSVGKSEVAVVVLDESSESAGPEASLTSIVNVFTRVTPVVVVADPGRQADLAWSIASGTVEFVPRTGSFAALAAGVVEGRVHPSKVADRPVRLSPNQRHGDFGELLRHEVNNPLTGILGNAELLLAGREGLPPDAAERLKTIAELAVRLRETVRRLSYAWGERDDDIRSA